MPQQTTGVVISPNQSQYDMVRGRGQNFQDIIISSSNQTTQGDIYIIPFIPNNYYWFGSNRNINSGTWRFDLGDVDRADMILIDYPLADLSEEDIDQLWDVSKIFEAGYCLWIDGYYIGEPLVSNGNDYDTLFSNGFTFYGNHPDSIELAWVTGNVRDRVPPIESSQFGLIDLSKINLDTVNNLTASQFQSSYGHLITSRASVIANPIINAPYNISVQENTTPVHIITADQPVIWALSGGSDISKFIINPITGELSFRLAPDYENPTDSNSDNIYHVDVQATDSAKNISTQPFNITILDDPNESSPLSDLEALKYIASNTDLITAFGIDIAAATSHYTNYGISEGRSLTVFSASVYLAKYSDLSAAFGNDETLALKHYIQYGYSEGRTVSSSASNSGSSSSAGSGSGSNTSSPTALSDFQAFNYIASNMDLISVFGVDIVAAKSHYINYGKSEGRPVDNFDEWGYLASNNDLMGVFQSNTTEAIKHFISFGKAEGRSTTIFNADSYLNNYVDLKAAFGNDHTLAAKHYVESGFSEGRLF